MKLHEEIFFLYKFWKSFVYFVKKEGICGSTSSSPWNLKFCMVVYIPKRNGISFAANPSQKCLYLGPPYCSRFRIYFQLFFPNKSYLFSGILSNCVGCESTVHRFVLNTKIMILNLHHPIIYLIHSINTPQPIHWAKTNLEIPCLAFLVVNRLFYITFFVCHGFSLVH